MNTQSLSLQVSPSIGAVSAEYTIPQTSICVMTLAHGAGAGMNHSFMVTLAKSLAEKEIATLRFNFPFAELKKGRPDIPAVAHKTVEAAIYNVQEQFPATSLSLFIEPPSIAELEKRLTARGTESPESIRSRISKASYEMTFKDRFDHIVINDKLEKACKEAEKLVRQFLRQ